MTTTAANLEVADTAREARDKGVDALLHRQHPDGWWKGDLESNVSIEAEDLLLRRFLGILSEDTLAATARWIRHRQRDDGTWSPYHEGPQDISITTEAYVALRLAGDPADASHMKAAREFILDSGGLQRTRVFTRIWMALFGEWSWDELPALLPEMILLPSWFPLNVYDFACWARQTIVPLTIVGSYRPARPLPFNIGELHTDATPKEREKLPLPTWGGSLQRFDKFLHFADQNLMPAAPFASLRKHALRKAERWIVERQEADGSWGGIQPPWVYSILALHLRGYGLDHPVMAKALGGFDAFEVREGDMRWLECCQSPVWDTALAVVALGDAGVPPDDPAMLRAGEWLLNEEVSVHGDWSVRRPNLAPGGWAFEFENDNYPDIDDTAEVALALTKVADLEIIRSVPAEGSSNTVGGSGGTIAGSSNTVGGSNGTIAGSSNTPAEGGSSTTAALQRAIVWTEGMQCSDGGYAAFDVDNTRKLCEHLPFCDFGEVIDPPSADVTAHAIEMLCHLRARFGDGDIGNAAIDSAALDRAVRWLLHNQEAEGSWFGRWGSNYLYGTGAAVPALIAAGINPEDRSIQRAVAWLHSVQNPDGGWGEDMRSYDDLAYKAKGESTASQTAWALLALIAAGDLSETTARGIAWLADTQREDGTWDEPWFTGTGFPGDFLINYHLYRDVFPVTALGRYVTALEHEAVNETTSEAANEVAHEATQEPANETTRHPQTAQPSV